MKLLWHSNAPWAPTGYGQQTALFAPRIRELGHDVALSAFYGLEGGIHHWNGMVVYPSDETKFGIRNLPIYAKTHAGTNDPRDCQVITLMDVWPVPVKAARQLKLASWTPVDHDPAPPAVVGFLRESGARAIAMSRFGQAALEAEGLEALYVPHGVDCELFQPWEDRAQIRSALKIPESAFVVGMVANNQGTSPPRKAFPQVFQAFSIFQREHADAFLYLHCEMAGVNHGVNLANLALSLRIPETSLGVTKQEWLRLGFPQDMMPGVYSAFDVLANPSYGEGFGIPIVEAQACGTPVVVCDSTAMPELCGAGWIVRGDKWYDPAQASYYTCPSVIEIVDALEAAYESAAGMRESAREFAVAYDASRVMTEYWEPVLETIARPREVAPLGGNRAQRRAAGRRRKRRAVA